MAGEGGEEKATSDEEEGFNCVRGKLCRSGEGWGGMCQIYLATLKKLTKNHDSEAAEKLF